MAKNRQLLVPKQRNRLVDIPSFEGGVDRRSDPSILPQHIAQNVYNFEFVSGALKAGCGIEKIDGLDFPPNVTAVWVFVKGCEPDTDIKRFYMCADKVGDIWYNESRKNGGTFNRLEGVKVTSPPMAVNYRLYGDDVIIICSPSDDMIVWDGVNAPYFVPDSPRVTSMVIHYERMFVTSADRSESVRFSQDLDPTNWNESLTTGGFIEMLDERGRLLRVLSYLNYVYIFREYGISRLTAFADQQDFSVTNLFVSGGRICPGSIALCGDRVVFLASDGLYMFNGLSTQKILSGVFVTGVVDNSVACFHNGKYYFATNLDFGDGVRVGVENGEYLNNALVVIDMSDGRYGVTRGVDIRQLVSAGSSEDNIFVVLADGKVGNVTSQSGKCFGEILPKRWETGHSDFGRADRDKLLREININTRYDITVTVISDREEKNFFVRGKAGVTRLRINMIGRLMTVRYESSAEEAYISRPSMVVRYM